MTCPLRHRVQWSVRKRLFRRSHEGTPVVCRSVSELGLHGCGAFDNAATQFMETNFLTALPTADVTFTALGVPASLVAVLAEDGITFPRPVQAATLPDALAGRDILGRAKTVVGKTLGFSLPPGGTSTAAP